MCISYVCASRGSNWKSHRSQEQRASTQEPPRAGVLAFFALESEEKNQSGPAKQVRGPRLPSLQAWPSPTTRQGLLSPGLGRPRSRPGEGGGGGEGGRVSPSADLKSRPEESLHPFTPTLMAMWETQVSAGEDVEKLEPSHFAGGEAKWFSCCGKWLRGSSRT